MVIIIRKKNKGFFSSVKTSFLTGLSFLLIPLVPEFGAPALAFCVFALFLRDLKCAEYKLKLNLLQIVVVAFMAWRLIGVFYSGRPLNALSIWAMWFLASVFVFCIPLVITSRENLERVIHLMVICAGIAGGLGVIQILVYQLGKAFEITALQRSINPFWGWLDTLLAKFINLGIWPDWFLKEIPHSSPIHFYSRANATFSNPLFFACFMVMVWPFSVRNAFFTKDKRKRIISLICSALMIGGLAVSYSRGPYIAMVFSAVLLILWGRKQAVYLAVILPITLAVLPSSVYSRFFTLLSQNDSSVNTRRQIYDACLDILPEKWLFGFGTGVEPLREYIMSVMGKNRPHAHNLFLEMIMENGIFGLLLFIAILVVIIIEMAKLCRHSKDGRIFGVTVISSLGAFCMAGMFDYSLYGLKIVIYFMMLLGLSIAGKNIISGGEKISLFKRRPKQIDLSLSGEIENPEEEPAAEKTEAAAKYYSGT